MAVRRAALAPMGPWAESRLIATAQPQEPHHDHPHRVDPHDQRNLTTTRETSNPAQIRRDIALIQANLTELARRRGIVQTRRKANATYLNKTKISNPPKRAS